MLDAELLLYTFFMDQRDLILEFIKRHQLTVIATVSPEGRPESAVIEFGQTDKLEIIFD